MNRYKYILILFFFAACSGKKTNLPGNIMSTGNNFTVMTFNLWLGGEANHQSIDKSVEVINTSGAKIIGLQEINGYNTDGTSHNNLIKIAEILGWNYIDQGGFGILSEYPICDTTLTKKGVKIDLGNNRFIWFFNCHLNYIPYQPYQLAHIFYGDYPFITTEKEAIAYADSARGNVVREYIREIEEVKPEGWPIILTGDFNEPSFQDWTQRAAEKGLCSIKVEWPSTKAFVTSGMIDAFRAYFPDEVKIPGKTWSSIDSPGEIHDRIDFIFYTGKQIESSEANTIGPKDGKSGIEIQGYPSDHRAVVSKFQWIKSM